ncbi:carbohydrate ABC transporter permease [Paracoccus salsus]|uniref:carbohydrate ABC transporter permease n=1 Tax=Paracoccus salsus TaxID=2911061 RepID=UPI001F3B36C9|nr:carbohydrate ABC transporter permease [Paracoccus salsus]MCF3974529.1 carbohydrate ABC transporter permease [Paracoccus salsus]
MARAVTRNTRIGWTIVAWAVALVIFFPILYTIITSFKSEQEAIAGFDLIPSLTLESYQTVQTQNNYFRPFMNSVILAVGSTLLALIVAIPAAWAMAFSPTRHTKNILMWMLSTKMMPAVAVLVPIYLIFLRFGLMDTRIGLTVLLMLINLPIVVWMLYTYFREIPGEILEAARMDGASLRDEILYILTPMAVPGIASTMLLNVILAWNEAFWTIQLTTTSAAPLSAFIASFSSPQGLFWAKLSAASTMAIAPILILGWFSQKQLVRGLTFGAVK